ncbi:DUF6086 family protein [Streptomyces rhizosphaericus]|uniref:DUF6086 family protein n=1 Tax=Streptomyces rhizosphaericus TaxID=114699 RepID=UPI002892C4D3|nr:DUF6086 family protein [Streptomyces rhizosphaericus]
MSEESLWNPSSGAARLFLRQTAVFEAELGLPSGLGPMDDDECQIDPAALGAFVNAVLAHYGRTRHAVIPALSEGFTAARLALASARIPRRAGLRPTVTRTATCGMRRSPRARPRPSHLRRKRTSRGRRYGSWTSSCLGDQIEVSASIPPPTDHTCRIHRPPRRRR